MKIIVITEMPGKLLNETEEFLHQFHVEFEIKMQFEPKPSYPAQIITTILTGVSIAEPHGGLGSTGQIRVR